ncbi:MAG: nuclease-related domain-containing protein [Sphaerobacter sp.]|nr:nuclease-related domain-containing protein [Sphaerobacter sp.]
MRLVVNHGAIKRQRRRARLMVLAGLVGLFSSFPLTLRPQLVLLAYAVLIVGFVLFNTGMQQLSKWGRGLRPDEILNRELRRLNDRYTLIHYPQVGGVQLEHVLVYPGGLLVILTRQVYGGVRVENNRWRRVGRRWLALFNLAGPPLGNPTVECQLHQKALRAYLESEGLPGADLIDGMIVFVHPHVQLEVVSSDLTVVRADELLAAVRNLGTEVVLHTRQREEIVAALARGEDVEGPVSLPSRDPSPGRARV